MSTTESNKREIKVKFVDFTMNFVPQNSIFYRLLSKHYTVLLSDTPDYLFYSVFGNEHLNYNCISIFWTGENQIPDFNICDYAIGFDKIEYGDRYLAHPLWYNYADCVQMEQKHLLPISKKNDFCSFVYSNNNASPERKQFFDLLSSYKLVHSGGRYMNNIGGSVADKTAFQQTHKFAIAFENCSHPGYTTEKIVQAFAAQTVPIYWGDPTVGETFNTKAFINCHDYPDFDAVLQKIKELDCNEMAYEAMLQEPALNPHTPTQKQGLASLDSFLVHIMEQEMTHAQRYSREYWGRKYKDRLNLREKRYRNSLYGIAERIYLRVFRSVLTGNQNIFLWKIHKACMKLMKR